MVETGVKDLQQVVGSQASIWALCTDLEEGDTGYRRVTPMRDCRTCVAKTLSHLFLDELIASLGHEISSDFLFSFPLYPMIILLLEEQGIDLPFFPGQGNHARDNIRG